MRLLKELALRQTIPTARYFCPKCSATRNNTVDRPLSMTVLGNRAAFQCWHCQYSGAIKLKPQGPKVVSMFQPKPIPTEQLGNSPGRIYGWLANRGITSDMAQKFGLLEAPQFFSKPNETQQAVGFPYQKDGVTYAVKWRSTESKAFSQTGSAQTFWLIDYIEKGEDVVICEGEADALALWQAGIHAVSIPNGAPLAVVEGRIDPREDNKFKYVWMAKETLDAAPRVILATDKDPQGQALAEELARRIGKAKCWSVEWPDGCKDANDVLRRHGKDILAECIDRAKPWPVNGLYDAGEFFEKVTSLYDQGVPSGESTGFPEIDDIYTIVPGQLSIVTGTPGSGKSAFLDNVMVNIARAKGWKFAVCSFENPPAMHIAKLAAIYAQQPFFDGPTPRMSVAKRDEALKWVREHFLFLHQSDGSLSSLGEIIELSKVAVMRYGIRGLCIDPVNYITKDGDSETEWVSAALTDIKVFAASSDIHVWLCAHPAKMMRKPDGGTEVPGGYSISGCYSDDTEVLTKRGWLRHSEISLSDEVGCFDPETSSMIYHRPSRIVKKAHAGDMYRFKGYGYDLLVTPEHRMLLKPFWKDPVGTQVDSGVGRPTKWPKGRWSFCEAKDVPRAEFLIPLSAPLCGDFPSVSEYALDLARLAGWYVSEGCKYSVGASISQAIGPRSDVISDLLNRLAVPFSVYVSGLGGKGGTKAMNSFYIGTTKCADLVAWLHRECGIGSANKKIPTAIVNGTPAVKEAFLEAYLMGDGSVKKKGYAATTTSRGLRDQLQILCLELGISASWCYIPPISEKHSDAWSLGICRRTRTQTAVNGARSITKTRYEGTVWCLTVPTGAYFVRRNGKAVVCGNSAHYFNKADMGITLHREDKTGNSARLHVWKSRFFWHGRIGHADLTYDAPTGTFIGPYRGYP